MSYLFRYIYYHFYVLVSKLKKRNIRESTILYVSCIVFFITFPALVFILYNLFSFIPKWFFLAMGALYTYLIHVLNLRYFERPGVLKTTLKEYRKESKGYKILGCTIVIILLILSPVVGFLVLFKIFPPLSP